jgi:hypothetical protein
MRSEQIVYKLTSNIAAFFTLQHFYSVIITVIYTDLWYIYIYFIHKTAVHYVFPFIIIVSYNFLILTRSKVKKDTNKRSNGKIT